jgi:hypothetical protein
MTQRHVFGYFLLNLLVMALKSNRVPGIFMNNFSYMKSNKKLSAMRGSQKCQQLRSSDYRCDTMTEKRVEKIQLIRSILCDTVLHASLSARRYFSCQKLQHDVTEQHLHISDFAVSQNKMFQGSNCNPHSLSPHGLRACCWTQGSRVQFRPRVMDF